MVYLEHSGSKFWRCAVVNDTTVQTDYGKCGTKGRTTTKDFHSNDDAETFRAKQEASKRKGGYVDAQDPNAPPPVAVASSKKKRKAATTAPTSPKKVSKKAGLAGHAAPMDIETSNTKTNNDGDGGGNDVELPQVVDSGVAGIDAALASRVLVHEEYHARLALVEPSINSDKYYILQLLVDENNNNNKNKKPKRGTKRTQKNQNNNNNATTTGTKQYHLFTRWGRTGTGGQCKLDGPYEEDDFDSAKAAFEKIFKSKTAIAWNQAVPGTAPKTGKYEFLAAAAAKKKKTSSNGDTIINPQWYYYLQNDPNGKANGWYEYDAANNMEVEELQDTFLASQSAERLAQRVVTSESSGWQYRVDLSEMTQTNLSSGTTRPIERTENGKPPAATAAGGKKKAKKAAAPKKKAPAPVAPVVSAPTAAAAATAATTTTSAPTKKAATGVVDDCASAAVKNGGTVYEDYNVMMNQTNLGANNNKFYKIQLIELSKNGGYIVFTKWGRVGEMGQTGEQGPINDLNQAMKEFAKKFRSKSGNAWDKYQDDKDSFVSKKGKYTVVEMEEDEEAAAAMEEKAAASAAANGNTTVVKKTKKPQKPIAPSSLDPATQSLVNLIFNEDMFKSAMSDMNLDPRKLPLGALSQTQLDKGYAILERLEDAIDDNKGYSVYEDITSEFYTIIPHAFGRSRGPVLTTKEKVQEKFDMLNTLSDIETAQAMQKKSAEKEKEEEEDDGETHRPNPSDVNYGQLATDLTLLDNPKDADMKLITKYFNDTKPDQNSYRGNMKLDKVWRVNRHDEDKRFAEHEDLKERKLLWHGTSVAVVAAILKSGLRIMPHSGGRVGKGIYLADQHQKSAGYTGSAQGKTIMFLVEAALGDIHQIQRDDSSLVAAPAGHHSVLARGQTEPPTVKEMKIDGKVVKVPQGKPKDVKEAKGSSFWHNEFLLYKESQHRIRYILCFDSK